MNANNTTLRLQEAVAALLPSIRERAGEVEQARRIPDDLVEQIRNAGVFRMLVPVQYGGLATDYPTTVALLKDFARADGAVAWSLMIGCETPQLLALLPLETFENMYSSGPDVVVAGAFAPKGKAVVEADGYRISGQWGFASGCEHADWLFGNCAVTDPAGGAPALRCALLPRGEWQILDTWHTAGLRGTGSHDIAINDRLVPAVHTFDLFGGTPCLTGPAFAAPLLQFSMHIGAVALGIAEGALQDLVDFAGTGKTRLYGRSPMTESELFQYRLGSAQADLRAADALLKQEAESYWQQAQDGHLQADLQTQVLQTVAWVTRTSVDAVDACYTAGGGSAIYDQSPLQRRLRDIHTLSQHASVQQGVFANNGAGLLGNPVGFGL